nr:MAG TPA: hypothetical protein [Caudoviricetes sp.]
MIKLALLLSALALISVIASIAAVMPLLSNKGD